MTQSTVTASILMCAGLAATYFLLPEGGSVNIYRTAAIGGALAIGLGVLVEAQRGIRKLIRADLLAIVALYGLSLVEFFFPQQHINNVIAAETATKGVEALFLGFVGLIVGRNFAPTVYPSALKAMPVQLSPRKVFLLYLVLLAIGYLPMLIAVGFDPAELVSQMLAPRFSQPWQRGRFGGWTELVGELGGLLLYLVPAVAGLVLADRSRYTAMQIAIIGLGLAFTLFYGFSSGTRNVFAVYLISFIGSYTIFKRGITWRHAAVLGTLTAGILYLSAYYMLQFRQVGLAAYLESGGVGMGYFNETLFIDHNLPVLSFLTDVFPETIQYLGLEVAYYAIVRPVPRALWPGKPETLSVEVADLLGLRGVTISSTFVGEAYMMGGYLAILAVGLLLGWLGGWWNRFGQDVRSNLGVALYASGFFAAMLSMRSVLWLTTAMLPSLALWLYIKTRQRRSHRSASRPVDHGASV